jgi:hypothetical protein
VSCNVMNAQLVVGNQSQQHQQHVWPGEVILVFILAFKQAAVS